MTRRERNQRSHAGEPRLSALDWSSPEQRKESVQTLHDHAAESARWSIQRYTLATRPNKRNARRLRGLSIVLVSIGGLIPVLSQILKGDVAINPAWASVAFGLGVAAIALDNFFGYSTAWARYTVARQQLETKLNTFELDYNALLNEVNGLDSLSLDQARPLIDCIQKFIADLDAIVENETLLWVAEFQDKLKSFDKASQSESSGVGRPPSSGE